MKSAKEDRKTPLVLHFQKELDVSEKWELKYQNAYYHSRKYNNQQYNVYKFHKKL